MEGAKSMGSTFFVETGSIYKLDQGLKTPATVLELWNHQKLNPGSDSRIRILGLGLPYIQVVGTPNDSLDYKIFLDADSEQFEVGKELNANMQYLASGSTVVPVSIPEFKRLAHTFQDCGLIAEDSDAIVIANQLIQVSIRAEVRITFDGPALEILDKLPVTNESIESKHPLWDYQKAGFSWMMRLWRNGLGGILGDEMGVGKTLQLLATACKIAELENVKPALVVVPGNLLLKWCKDFVDFFPQIASKVYVHHGASRLKAEELIAKQSIILTTYGTLVADEAIFCNIEFSVVCCDESHELKDPRTLKTRALRSLKSRSKFLATGTPIQNNLLDYWSLITLIAPEWVGSATLATAETFENTPEEARNLMEVTKHRILRRTQEQVQLTLPEGYEVSVPLELPIDLAAEYGQIIGEIESNDNNTPKYGHLQTRRQFCAHPGAFLEFDEPLLGPKASYLLDEIEKISTVQEKAVVFVADFNRPLDLYMSAVRNEFPSIWTGFIDGRVAMDVRHIVLSEFTSFQGSAVLFVSPAVGGQGLDMVAANHVFHMNPSWNPAKTDQATFRVTRPGQTKETVIHHLYYINTIEERIVDLVSQKREISEAALEIAEAEAHVHENSLISHFANHLERN
jgi:SNF2 family DNA or RNA helicase